jgi:hypothetical protein
MEFKVGKQCVMKSLIHEHKEEGKKREGEAKEKHMRERKSKREERREQTTWNMELKDLQDQEH